MIGVILWSDVTDRKAVIWCEDQGDLAFVGHGEAELAADDFFDVGDVVSFEITTQSNLRLARKAHRLGRNFGSTLQDCLVSIPEATRSLRTAHSAEVIPFRPGASAPPRSRVRSQQIG